MLNEDKSRHWLLEQLSVSYSDVATHPSKFNALTVTMLAAKLVRLRQKDPSEFHRQNTLEEVADNLEELAEQV